MSHRKEIVTAVGTLAIAVGIGFVMQSSDSAQQRYGAAKQHPQVAMQGLGGIAPSVANFDADVVLEVEEIELTSATDAAPVSAPISEIDSDAQQAETTDMPGGDGTAMAFAEDCDMVATANALPGGMVNLMLEAPCAQNERLTVHHNGMIFTQTTDADGLLSVMVPALVQDAVFIMAFSNGDGAVAQVAVDDLAQYERVALQWRGKAGFELHAREFGADYGDAGHIWSGAEPNVAGLQSGNTGYLMRLGDADLPEPLMAEVYTFATGMAATSGTIDLTVEAEVTMDNCGLEIEAQSLEKATNGEIRTRDLTLAVPSCDTVGSFLVLNNLVADLKVASN